MTTFSIAALIIFLFGIILILFFGREFLYGKSQAAQTISLLTWIFIFMTASAMTGFGLCMIIMCLVQ
ncbi:MAG: hypothetical protein LBQ37_02380 [Elusimicrobiota bacterium]|jgi:hypothetical protein|nr:hypothetical protein [Elusimicrobiota bacterium]